MIDPSTQRENIICVSTASFCHKASNGSHVFFVRVGGTVCKWFHLSHTHTHIELTMVLRLHTMSSQNDRTHSTIYSLSLSTITRYTLWDVLQDSSTSHRLFCFSSPLTPPSSFKSRIQLLQTLLHTYMWFYRANRHLFTKRKSILNSSCCRCPGLLCLFIWVTVSALAVSALQCPNMTSYRTHNWGLTSSCLILNDSLREIRIMRMYSKRQRERLIRRP